MRAPNRPQPFPTLPKDFDAQGGVCAICREPETVRNPRGGVKRLAVDHCHERGVVRGLRCTRCNVALGYLRHAAALLAQASAYLSGASQTVAAAPPSRPTHPSPGP